MVARPKYVKFLAFHTNACISTRYAICVFPKASKNLEKPPKMSKKSARFGFRKGPFHLPKGFLSHSKRAPFANQEDKKRKIGRFFTFRGTVFPVFRPDIFLKRK